ncbi:MAG: hypothetical protein ACHQQ3_01215 [Gemmatimonadales bacterium]
MHGRNPVSTGALAAALAMVAVLGGCERSATTGPTQLQSKDFAAALRSIQGDQQIGGVGAPLSQQLVVKVVDANGQAVSGATVTFSVRAGGGSVNPPAFTSNDTGLVRATWTLGTTLGANKVVAQLTNGFVLDSALFTAQATPGAPAQVVMVSGDLQSGRVGKPLALPLVVKVTDAYGFTKSGTKVVWTPGFSSGTVAFTAGDTTAADGSASAMWTLGSLAIPQIMTASVTGIAGGVTFHATTSADTGRLITVVSGLSQTGPVAGALGTALRLKVTDQYGNIIVGDTVVWNDSIAGGGSVSTIVGATGADGTAQTTWTLGNHAGPQFLRARTKPVAPSGSSVASATFNFTATATVAFSEVFAGNFQACAITASNQRVYCWGNNDAGQLAKGTNINSTAPSAAVAIGSDTINGPFLQVRQMSGGQDQFCALTVSRRMYCWGRVMGSAPVNTATEQALTTGGSNGNQQILANFIAAGEEHICVMDLVGLAFCTGNNLHGQLGDGAAPVTPQINTYTFVIPFNFLWSNISAGFSHTCAVPRFNPANATSQVPRCWGVNNSGQVGNGTLTFTDVTTPQSVVLPTGVTAFDSLSIATGAQHSCAVAVVASGTLGGPAYCWGNNAFGQLGKGAAVTAASRDSVPVPVAGGITFARLFAGKYHTCGLDLAGGAWCWGRNDYGQLGDGTRTSQLGPVAVVGGNAFRSLSLGELYTCGVAATPGTPFGAPSASPGTVYCWGDNVFGQLGQGTAASNAPILGPTKVLYQP